MFKIQLHYFIKLLYKCKIMNSYTIWFSCCYYFHIVFKSRSFWFLIYY